MNKFLKYIFLIIFLLSTNVQNANEILIYADNISYDSKKNIIAKGNAKIISGNEIIMSDLIIYNKHKLKYILPGRFEFKDSKNNLYNGSSGEFSKDLQNAIIHNPKISLSDGSRMVGQKLLRKNQIDLLTKGSFSPCTSRINIKNFQCPIWQIEDEKILHDRDKLLLYHKHSKMKIFNIPVAYLPYLVTPSPLRKKRKSGFLNPTISFNFIDVKKSHSVRLPYYFNINIDKELFFTPVINYGAGVDSSQRFLFDYYQIISGGKYNINMSYNTKIENENNETWIQDGSIIANYEQNLNEKFKLDFNTAFQSSPTYLKKTDISNLLNQDVSLNTSLNVHGYALRNFDDHLDFRISGYQVVQENDNNKNSPTAIPYVKYDTGKKIIGKTNYNNKFSFYNIVRDSSTGALAQRQQKLYHNLSTDYEIYKYKSKINFKTELLTQSYHIEQKPIDGKNYTGYYSRIFPMSGIYIETPLKNDIYDIKITPKYSFIINGSQASSNKVSNEESENTSYTLMNHADLNRYSGSDKLDNSKRFNYGLGISKDKFSTSIAQSYEFDSESNYNKDVGLKNNLSDVLFAIGYNAGKIFNINYNNRYSLDLGQIKSQKSNISNESKYGLLDVIYTKQKSETNQILTTDTESLDLTYTGKKFKKYNTILLKSNYDLIKNYATNYTVGYEYIDECFGVNIDYTRTAVEDRNLTPDDTLTIMFSFKFLGSYQSTNLAVSEIDKQDIRWKGTQKREDELFYPITNTD